MFCDTDGMVKYTGTIYDGERGDRLYKNDPRTLQELCGFPYGKVQFVVNGEMADGSKTYMIKEDYERGGYNAGGYCVQWQRDRHGVFYVLTVDKVYY